jgi:hypothetical protein
MVTRILTPRPGITKDCLGVNEAESVIGYARSQLVWVEQPHGEGGLS